ncbi:MAG: DUF3179 domain-containing (seleno)protein [bacterium]
MRQFLSILTFSLFILLMLSPHRRSYSQEAGEKKPMKSVKGLMQTRPGGSREEVEVDVHEVPTDLPVVPAGEATLNENDLVLGVVQEGQAVAFPVRFLAMHEVVDSKVGKLPVAPTW